MKNQNADKPQRRRVQQSFKNVVSMTQQSDKPMTSVRHLLKHGLVPPNDGTAIYGDFTNAEEYQESMERLVRAQESFDALPATIRDRFENDPGQLIEFLNDENNRDEAIDLGLLNRPNRDASADSVVTGGDSPQDHDSDPPNKGRSRPQKKASEEASE